jgi:hypothetical protein
MTMLVFAFLAHSSWTMSTSTLSPSRPTRTKRALSSGGRRRRPRQMISMLFRRSYLPSFDRRKIIPAKAKANEVGGKGGRYAIGIVSVCPACQSRISYFGLAIRRYAAEIIMKKNLHSPPPTPPPPQIVCFPVMPFRGCCGVEFAV